MDTLYNRIILHLADTLLNNTQLEQVYSYRCICLSYFAGTELDNQNARAEFINENTKTLQSW